MDKVALQVSEETEDAELLAAIAQNRDEKAFDLLLRRHERAAYNLALHITFSSVLAEDAVQQAMFSLWKTAVYFRSECKVRTWILRLVAREACRIRNEHSRHSMRELQTESTVRSEAPPEDAIERTETEKVLRVALSELPTQDRQVVALYFGAGMSRDEIGKELSLSGRTISYRLESILGTLRKRMSDCGLAAVVPHCAEELENVICSGPSAPPHMLPNVLGQIAASGRLSMVQSATASILFTKTLIATVVALVLAATLGLGWFLAHRSQTITLSGQPEPAALPDGPGKPDTVPAPVPAPRFQQKWDFNTPPSPEDFTLPFGSWRHTATGGANGSGCMETETDTFSVLFNRVKCKGPLLVTFQFQDLPPAPPNGFITTAGWTECVGTMARLNGLQMVVKGPGNWLTEKDYLTPSFIAGYTEGQLTAFRVSTSGPNSIPGLLGRGRIRIDNLAITEISESELPEVSVYLNAIQAIDSAKRVGTVPLPTVKSADGKRTVSVTFGTE